MKDEMNKKLKKIEDGIKDNQDEDVKMKNDGEMKEEDQNENFSDLDEFMKIVQLELEAEENGMQTNSAKINNNDSANINTNKSTNNTNKSTYNTNRNNNQSTNSSKKRNHWDTDSNFPESKKIKRENLTVQLTNFIIEKTGQKGISHKRYSNDLETKTIFLKTNQRFDNYMNKIFDFAKFIKIGQTDRTPPNKLDNDFILNLKRLKFPHYFKYISNLELLRKFTPGKEKVDKIITVHEFDGRLKCDLLQLLSPTMYNIKEEKRKEEEKEKKRNEIYSLYLKNLKRQQQEQEEEEEEKEGKDYLSLKEESPLLIPPPSSPLSPPKSPCENLLSPLEYSAAKNSPLSSTSSVDNTLSAGAAVQLSRPHKNVLSEKQNEAFMYIKEFFDCSKNGGKARACVGNVLIDSPAGTGKTQLIIEIIDELADVSVLFLSTQHILLNQVRAKVIEKFGRRPKNVLIGTIAKYLLNVFECNLYQFNKIPFHICNGVTKLFKSLNGSTINVFFNAKITGRFPYFMNLGKKILIVIDEYEMLNSSLLELIYADINLWKKIFDEKNLYSIMFMTIGHSMQIGPLFSFYHNEAEAYMNYINEMGNCKLFEFSKRFRSKDDRLTKILMDWESMSKSENYGDMFGNICNMFKEVNVPVFDRSSSFDGLHIDYRFNFDYLKEKFTIDNNGEDGDDDDELRMKIFVYDMPIVINRTNENVFNNNTQMWLLYMSQWFLTVEGIVASAQYEQSVQSQSISSQSLPQLQSTSLSQSLPQKSNNNNNNNNINKNVNFNQIENEILSRPKQDDEEDNIVEIVQQQQQQQQQQEEVEEEEEKQGEETKNIQRTKLPMNNLIQEQNDTTKDEEQIIKDEDDNNDDNDDDDDDDNDYELDDDFGISIHLDHSDPSFINFNGWQAPTIDFKYFKILRTDKYVNPRTYTSVFPLLPGCPYRYTGMSNEHISKNEQVFLVRYYLYPGSYLLDYVIMYSKSRKNLMKFYKCDWSGNFFKYGIEHSFPFILDHACTAQSCIGLNIPSSRKIYVNTHKLSMNEFYVAMSRGETLDHFGGILTSEKE